LERMASQELDIQQPARATPLSFPLLVERLRERASSESLAQRLSRMLAELETTGESFFDLALRMSRPHKEYFLALYPPNVERQAEFKAEAEESLGAQASIEAADKLDFEQFLAQYAAG